MMRKTVCGIVVGVLLAYGGVVLEAGQMTMVKGDLARTGYVNEAVQLPLSLMWQYTTPPYANNPSVPLVTYLKEAEDNVVFFTVENEVFAVKASTGELAWQKQYELISGNASGPSTLAGDRLLINCSDGNLYAVNIRTGALEWRSLKRSSTHVAPTVLDGKIYSGTTGSGLWISSLADGSSQPTDVIPTNGQVYSSPAYAEPYLFFTDSAGYIYRYDRTRPPSATNPVKTPGGSTSLYSTPVVWNNLVLLGNGTGKAVLALSIDRMEVRWSVPLTGSVYASPSVTPEGRVYVSTTDGKVYCLDASQRGRIVWEKRLEATATPDVRAAATVTANGLVFVGTLRGILYALDAKTGDIRWKYRLPTDNVRPAAIRTPLTIVDGKAFLMSDDGSLYCFASDAFDAEPPA
ncbi:MAG: PQQ-binding-like beta-propeller repeat protein, partial [Abditibacteriales bacterium]|nr:PQQ-binding-like beta-propeller repeat protein [Abditibacteriales bacterium]MDW8364914.1 PQQ-binding-like beta-propeller repeat protein [Abditibacteriales bacterium]